MKSNNMNQFVDTEEFTSYINKYIFSEDFHNAYKGTYFSTLPEQQSKHCINAMRHGMIWAVLVMNAEIKHYYAYKDV